MIIERSREHTVNLGNYENVKVGAKVTLTDDDIKRFSTMDEAITAADQFLDDLLRDDLAEAAENVPQGQDTHLESWKK